MRSLSLVRHTLAFAALACLAAPNIARAQTVITTIPANATFGAAFAVVGETFTTPTDNILNSFAYQLDQIAPLTLSVYAYNPTANVTVGPALFTSAPTVSTTVQGSNGYAFNTGNLALKTGSVYVALLSGANNYGGPVAYGSPDAYTGGTLVYGNNTTTPLTDFSALFSTPIDAAFRATFSSAAVPEPGSVALLVGMGVTGAGFLSRRRLNRCLRFLPPAAVPPSPRAGLCTLIRAPRTFSLRGRRPNCKLSALIKTLFDALM